MCNGFVWGIVEGDRCRTICAERALKPLPRAEHRMCNGFVWGIVEGDRCRTICAERALKPSFRVIVGGSQRIGPSAKVSTAMNCLQRSRSEEHTSELQSLRHLV